MAPIEEASTLPSSWYVDPSHHARELELVFSRTWQQVGRTAQLAGPGDYLTAEVAGEPLVAVRGRDGVLRAFFNVCRHRAGVVARGEGCAERFRCTYHGWTYGLDGRLLGAPEMDGVSGFAPEDTALPPVRCEAWGPYVFANLDGNASPLLDCMGPLPRLAGPHRLDELEFGVRETYTIACNWKVYVDNYLEGYHIPAAHPGLHRQIDYRGYAVTPDGPVITQGTSGRADDGARYLYLWLFPNFMINVNPDYAQTNLIVPTGPGSTLCVFDYFFPPGAGEEEAERRRRASIEWSDEIQREDIWLCESVQRNLRSRSYRAGRYSARRENGVYHFHELLRAALA